MIRQIDLRRKPLSKSEYAALLPRASMDVASAIKLVEPILARVKSGDESELIKLATEFDGVTPKKIKVAKSEIESALNKLDPQLKNSLQISIERVKKVHREQTRDEQITKVVEGGQVTQRWIPVDRVGLYVPAGGAIYPSSVIMNVVPAQIAKVKSIAIASPPQKSNGGLPDPLILATCALLGVDEIYAVGGAQAIALFAYGVKDLCDKCDLVTGPGNIYVAAAKRALRGVIGIDSEAGPTEIAIIADESADAAEVASDLISQAEHDSLAASILITTSQRLITEVKEQLAVRVKATLHSERIEKALTSIQSAIVLVDSISQAIDVANAYAAEHLEIQTKNARSDSELIRNAGAVFIGPNSPVSLGDYSAGSNHVLPTGGCACHSSGLSVQTFLRSVQFIEYDKKALGDIADTVITLANAENLPAHGEAIKARFEK
jgi:histidinol dehydrogenase